MIVCHSISQKVKPVGIRVMGNFNNCWFFMDGLCCSSNVLTFALMFSHKSEKNPLFADVPVTVENSCG